MTDSEHRVPVAEEVLTIDKRVVPTGRVRIETRTETLEEIAEVSVDSSCVEVTSVPIGREVAVAPPVRTEGDVTIIPVVEEELVIRRRLVLREEVHVRRHRTVETVQVPVELRKQQVRISRDAPYASEGSINMTDTTTNIGTGGRTLAAFFDHRSAAETAQQRLVDLGLPGTTSRLTGGEEYAGHAGYQEERGFWDGLLDFFFPNEETATYAEGIRRGGYLLTVSAVPANQYDQVVDILDEEGSIDLDERASSWREEGWMGMPTEPGAGSAVGATSASFGNDPATDAADLRRQATPGITAGIAEGTGSAMGGVEGTPADRDDETIQVVEEQLRVGKRDVNLGRVRVRSYVVEEPASADVRLRDERVQVERRPVDRPVEAGEDAFVDRTIEAEEHTEEAVVAKEARVTEEIGLRRESEERTETVSDTVRRTEVEVEDERADALRETVAGRPGG